MNEVMNYYGFRVARFAVCVEMVHFLRHWRYAIDNIHLDIDSWQLYHH
jgi:hypothetical protein